MEGPATSTCTKSGRSHSRNQAIGQIVEIHGFSGLS